MDYGCGGPEPCDLEQISEVYAGAISLGLPLVPTLFPPEYQTVDEGELFVPGEVFSIDAEGDFEGVPAFSGSMTAPSYPVFLAPPSLSVGSEGYVLIDRTQPLELEWSDAEHADAILSVSALDQTVGHFTCRFRAVDARATIPAEMMSTLTASVPGNTQTYFQFRMIGWSDLVIPADTFEIVATAHAESNQTSFLSVVQ